jgi:hypothetical protein
VAAVSCGGSWDAMPSNASPPEFGRLVE